MKTHSPTGLEGPVTAARPWWHRAARAQEKLAQDPAPEPLFRAGLVEEVRRQIAAGTYDTAEKWETALTRLLQRLEVE
jgi:hypothetical protein